MTKWFLSFLIVLFALTVKAQSNVIDSIKVSLQEKPKFFMSLNNRNTFIRSNKTKLYGLTGGFDYNEKVKLFVGIYGFGDANETLLINDIDFVQDSVFRYINTSNFSLGIEYDYWEYERLHLSFPIQIGIGSINYEFVEKDKSTPIRIQNYNIVPIEFGSNAYLELLTGVGLKAGIGYRMTLGKKEASQLSSPYYNLGISILVGEIYKDIKKNINYKP
ncbi:MAG: hypothetical protein COA58_05590 [Bacteroidetes bacterium]|nr:MAG: hypothetical protein COA58_05590 [Bacteroidota bacterium]